MDNKKYIKCFSNEEANKLKNTGFHFLYERDGIFYFENNQNLINNFEKENTIKNVKFSSTINF